MAQHKKLWAFFFDKNVVAILPKKLYDCMKAKLKQFGNGKKINCIICQKPRWPNVLGCRNATTTHPLIEKKANPRQEKATSRMHTVLAGRHCLE